MRTIYIGVICLCYSLFLLFISPREKNNLFGYKSLQQNMHKDIWKWTNECFGLLLLIGSVVYMTVSIIFEVKKIASFQSLNLYGIIYVVISFVATECYGMIRRYQHTEK